MTKYRIMLSSTQRVMNDYTGKPREFRRVETANGYATLSRFKAFSIEETPS